MTINTNDVLSAITQASEALAREPSLRSQIIDLESTLGKAQNHNMNLESNIRSYKETITSLEDKVRSLEVERDQAQFRTLELEDSFASLREAIGHANQNACQQMDKLFPRPPEPIAEQPSPVTPPTGNPELAVPDHSSPVVEQVPASPPSTPYPDTPPQATADPVGFSGLNEADVKPPGKFANRKWSDANYEMNNKWDKSEWDANGGTYDGWNS